MPLWRIATSGQLNLRANLRLSRFCQPSGLETVLGTREDELYRVQSQGCGSSPGGAEAKPYFTHRRIA
jgi:hypothetical protein